MTNYPELNNQLKEGLLEKMLGRARSDEGIQQPRPSKAILAVVSKMLAIANSPSKRDKEQIKARALGVSASWQKPAGGSSLTRARGLA